MDVTQTAARAARWAADQAARAAGSSKSADTGDPPRPVTLTIAAPVDEVRALFRDGQRLSRVVGDLADVHTTDHDHAVWRFHPTDGADGPPGSGDATSGRAQDGVVSYRDTSTVVTTEIVESPDAIVFRRVATDDSVAHDGSTALITVEFRLAPDDLGTEVSLTLDLPTPDVATRVGAFAVLYRTRALLQTGEIPTLTPTPAARAGQR